jgi:AcrR family transcriptional regulator
MFLGTQSYMDEANSYTCEEMGDRFRFVPMATDETLRTRAAHLGPERRRPQVLNAALAITVEQGVGQVTIGTIADRLQVTRPVVYACFDGRVEIITALLERETTNLRDALVAALRTARGHDPESAFVDGFGALLRVAAARPDSWRVVFAAQPDPAVVDRFQRVRAEMQDIAGRWIRPALSAWWDFADVDAKLPVLVEFFLSSCEAAVRSLLDAMNTWTADDLASMYGRMVCSAFRAAGEPIG